MSILIDWACSLAASYLVVFMALDRSAALLAPFWYRENTNYNTASKISFGAGVIGFVFSSPSLYLIRRKRDVNECELNTDALSDSFFFVFRVFNTIYLFVIPFLVLLSSNVLFAIKLNKRVRNRPPNQNADPETGKFSITESRNKKDAVKQRNRRDYTKMLVSVTCSYLIISSAISFSALMAAKIRESNRNNLSGFLLSVKDLLQILNSSTSFIFFCLSGKTYRGAFKRAIYKVKDPS